MKRMLPAVVLGMVLWAGPSLALQWENPKTLVGDPTKVRLQQGRKELTTREREEIAKYGFTGLELMTYVYANKHPLPDNDFINRCINYDGISLSVVNWLFRRRYNYKDLMDKLTHKSVKPGDVEYVLLGYDADSPKNRGLAILFINYARSETTQKNYEQWAYLPALKRVRKDTPRERGDEYYGMFSTLDDDEVREPWEEEHAILGEDSYQGKEVLVVESRHRFNPKYYLSKRVSWVEKTNFLDLHEEQFNRAGQLSKMIDLNWLQVRPTLHWVQREVNLIKLPKGERTLHQNVSWKIGNGYKEADFAMRLLETERPWRAIDHNLPALRQPSDLPPAPKVRMEFWKKLGVTVTIAH